MTSDCDLCGSSSRLPLPQDPRISICARCGFVYVSERRSSEEVAAAWDDIYRNGLYSPEWPAVKARLYYVAEWIDQTIGFGGKSVLDIGAGDGFFLRQVRERNGHPVGLDPSAHNCRGIRAYDIACFAGTAESIGPCGQYDIVTINWTLENCADCLSMLRFARDRLLPGGHVVVATGSRILVPFKKPLSSYLNKDIPADLHCFRWSAASLHHALQKSGLGMVKTNAYTECDWLVVEASAFHAGDGVDDSPAAVLQHFADWARMWP